jgi:predicted metal-dependent HD superfamily phosphohydrolase
MGKYEEAVEAILSGLRSSRIRPPSMIAYLTGAYVGQQEGDKAKALLTELVERSEANEKGVNIYTVYAFYIMGDLKSARIYLEKAKKTNDVDLIWWHVDPLLKNFREQSTNEIDMPHDFDGAEQHIMTLLDKEMPNLQYHNIKHIYDVLESSLVIAESEKVSVEEIKLLRLAALYHDAGFIRSSANHEERGTEMAREILPAYGLSCDQIDTICGMIMATRIPQSPSTKLERILCDADLDYLGRDDFYEIGGRLFEELRDQTVVETEREWNLVQKTFLNSHRYHTNYSKANRERFKNERLQEIVAKLKNRA